MLRILGAMMAGFFLSYAILLLLGVGHDLSLAAAWVVGQIWAWGTPVESDA